MDRKNDDRRRREELYSCGYGRSDAAVPLCSERASDAHLTRGRVGKMEFIEAAVRHTEVRIWVAPATQSAQRVTVLPERRFKEVGCIYAAIRN